MKKLIVLSVLAVNSLGFAQTTKGAESAGVSKKTTELVFEAGDTIDGTLTQPDVEYIGVRTPVQHSGLIKIREEFKDKVIQSVGEL